MTALRAPDTGVNAQGFFHMRKAPSSAEVGKTRTPRGHRQGPARTPGSPSRSRYLPPGQRVASTNVGRQPQAFAFDQKRQNVQSAAGSFKDYDGDSTRLRGSSLQAPAAYNGDSLTRTGGTLHAAVRSYSGALGSKANGESFPQVGGSLQVSAAASSSFPSRMYSGDRKHGNSVQVAALGSSVQMSAAVGSSVQFVATSSPLHSLPVPTSYGYASSSMGRVATTYAHVSAAGGSSEKVTGASTQLQITPVQQPLLDSPQTVQSRGPSLQVMAADAPAHGVSPGAPALRAGGMTGQRVAAQPAISPAISTSDASVKFVSGMRQSDALTTGQVMQGHMQQMSGNLSKENEALQTGHERKALGPHSFMEPLQNARSQSPVSRRSPMPLWSFAAAPVPATYSPLPQRSSIAAPPSSPALFTGPWALMGQSRHTVDKRVGSPSPIAADNVATRRSRDVAPTVSKNVQTPCSTIYEKTNGAAGDKLDALIMPGDVLVSHDTGGGRLADIGRVGGYFGHVLLATLCPRRILRNSRNGQELAAVWPDEDISEIWAVNAVECTRKAPGLHETEILLYVDHNGVLTLIGEENQREGLCTQEDEVVELWQSPQELRKQLRTDLMMEALEEMRVQIGESDWSVTTAARAMLTSASFSRGAVEADVSDLWQQDPICTSVVIGCWQRYLCKIAQAMNAASANGNGPFVRPIDLIMRWMPLKADRGLPGELLGAMQEAGWVRVANVRNFWTGFSTTSVQPKTKNTALGASPRATAAVPPAQTAFNFAPMARLPPQPLQPPRVQVLTSQPEKACVSVISDGGSVRDAANKFERMTNHYVQVNRSPKATAPHSLPLRR